MPDDPRSEAPLASFVLRVRGRPATLRYELHNLRTGDRRIFTRVESLAAFVRQQGLEVDGLEPYTRNVDDRG